MPRDTSRRRNIRNRRNGARVGARKKRLLESGVVFPARRVARTWKRNIEALIPEVPEIRAKVMACQGVPDVGRYPGYECNRRRIVQWAVGHPGVRCRECTVATAYRTTLSRWEPDVVIALMMKLWREKKIGRAGKRPPNYERGE